MLFETGYGPSGLPHIGTFGEVARTTMVRHAFRVLTDDKIKTRLLAFSDDMDGLRKVPDNVPNKEHAGAASRQAADPGARSVRHACELRRAQQCAAARVPRSRSASTTNSMSSTDYYTSGRFDAALLTVLERFEAVMAIMLPSLREERAADLFAVPADPSADRHRDAGADLAHDAKRRHHHLRDPETQERVTPVTGGHCKLQWKPDWAMRWFALGVDYEMAGKDLIDSVKLSGEIAARSAARRRKASTTSSSSTRRARRSPSRRATA